MTFILEGLKRKDVARHFFVVLIRKFVQDRTKSFIIFLLIITFESFITAFIIPVEFGKMLIDTVGHKSPIRRFFFFAFILLVNLVVSLCDSTPGYKAVVVRRCVVFLLPGLDCVIKTVILPAVHYHLRFTSSGRLMNANLVIRFLLQLGWINALCCPFCKLCSSCCLSSVVLEV